MIRRIIRNLQPHQSLRSNQMQYSMYLIPWGNFHENFFLPREFLLFIIFKQHLLIHTEERPYSCSGCSASFIRKGDAQRHVRVVHNKVRPFQCDLCSRTFCDKKHLRWHLQHHDKSCYYFCGQCNRKFIKKDYWESHIRFLHNENTEDQSEKEVKNSDVSQLQVDINNEETLALKEKESQDDSSSFELPDFLNLDVDTGDLDFVADTNNICF